jgi:hypothetical protein
MRAILKQNSISKTNANYSRNVFGEKIGVLGKVFGCWHKNLTRPFTMERESYRACVECGARRRFDAGTLRTFGSFHYPPAVAKH